MKTTTLRTLTLIAAAAVTPIVTHALTYDGITLQYYDGGTVLRTYIPANSPYYLPTDVQDPSSVVESWIGGSGNPVLIADNKTIDEEQTTGGSGVFKVGNSSAPGTLIMQGNSQGFFRTLMVGGHSDGDGKLVIDSSIVSVLGNGSSTSLYVGGRSYGEVVVQNGGVISSQGNVLVGSHQPGAHGSGKLFVDGSSALNLVANAIVIVGNESGGELVIGAGGHISAGKLQPGTGVSFETHSTFTVGLNASMANVVVGDAPVRVETATVLSGARLSVETGGSWLAVGDEYIIISAAIYGDPFDGLINSVVTSDTGQIFDVDYRSHAVVLIPTANAIPEPSTYALLGGVGAVALAVLRRRRRG